MSIDHPEASRPLPDRPNLRHLKDQAKDLLDTNDIVRVKIMMTRNPKLHSAPLGYGKDGPLTEGYLPSKGDPFDSGYFGLSRRGPMSSINGIRMFESTTTPTRALGSKPM